jgi:predicted RNase H-like HicB family nuclease
MKYVYPAIFVLNDDGTYTVTFPDLPGCITEGQSLTDAIDMAEDAAATWLWVAENEKSNIPIASPIPEVTRPDIASYVKINTSAFRQQMDSRAVKKTLTIPAWLNTQAKQARINFSGVLQDALKEQLKTRS